MGNARLLHARPAAVRTALSALLLAACGPDAPAPTAPAAPDVPGLVVAPPPGGGCVESTTAGSGALTEFCFPAGWEPSDGLVLYAHGYVDASRPLALPDDQVGGVTVADLTTTQGFAYASTSYRDNGLVIAQGQQDLLRLLQQFERVYGEVTGPVYVVGASEGALVATLALERWPQLFDGGLALCGPVGDFQTQIDYFGGFRARFDQVFETALNLPGDAVTPPDAAFLAAFGKPDAAVVSAAIALAATGDLSGINALPPVQRDLLLFFLDPAHPERLVALQGVLAASGAAFVPGDPVTTLVTTLGLLWYSFNATGDAIEVLGGNPFGGFGFTADPNAVTQVRARYTTTGRLSDPLVLLHNPLDPIVPFAQSALYENKADAVGSGDLVTLLTSSIPYGHCSFTQAELLGALGTLVAADAATPLAVRAEPR